MAQERRLPSDAKDSARPDRVHEQTSERPDEEAIRQRAYDRFRERGGEHGRDFDDWLEAEHELSEGVRRR